MPISPTKVCGPQDLQVAMPSHEMADDQLQDYCLAKYQEITRREKGLAQVYWQMGQALTLLQDRVAHGDWGQTLARIGIDTSRASKAKAIFRTFSHPEQLVGLSVEQAYAQRKRKLKARIQAEIKQPEGPSVLKACVTHVRAEIACLREVPLSITASEALDLLILTDAAIHQLMAYRKSLRKIAEQDGPAAKPACSKPSLKLRAASEFDF